MLTYVINTSENKTFDTSRLFELAGYSKIRWVQCALNEIPKCVEYITDRQNSVIADDFRIAIIIDFYGFDKIRIPYGRKGFNNDEGVDMSLYLPYIEVYLLDNLIFPLENKELYAKDVEIYYVQNERSERYELFKNAPSEIKQILKGNEKFEREAKYDELKSIAQREITDYEVEKLTKAQSEKYLQFIAKEFPESAEDKIPEMFEDAFVLPIEVPPEDESAQKSASGKKSRGKEEEISAAEIQARKKLDNTKIKVALLLEKKAASEFKVYKSFTMYCTKNISLEFPLEDYPYGASEMCFEDFWDAFRNRVAIKTDIRRHYYVIPYGGGVSRSALYTLSLSLYLIHMYEREETISGEGDMDVEKVDSHALCEALENGWCKINTAKMLAKKNNLEYYSLTENNIISIVESGLQDELDAETAISNERAALPSNIVNTRLSPEKLYTEIEGFAGRTASELKKRNREEFDKIMGEYLQKRDETREADVEAEFIELKNGGFLKTTPQCPSKEQYNYIVGEKQKLISGLFDRVLSAEYIEVDYTEERKKAKQAYLDYKTAKAWMTRNILGDIVFLILTLAAMLVPYCLLQLTSRTATTTASIILALFAAGAFGGLFICSIILQLIPMIHKLQKAKTRLRNYYIDCCAKESYSFSSIRRRYRYDLISIEQTRYELRQLKHLFEENLDKEKNVLMHRRMLDDVSDCLSSMLNNLDVEPVYIAEEPIEGEFDLSKSVYSKYNKIYQIFSLETIEKIFTKKGRVQK